MVELQVVSRVSVEDADGHTIQVRLVACEPGDLPPEVTSIGIQFSGESLGNAKPFEAGRRFMLVPSDDYRLSLNSRLDPIGSSKNDR